MRIFCKKQHFESKVTGILYTRIYMVENDQIGRVKLIGSYIIRYVLMLGFERILL
jgi:hypothetical protein